MDQHEPISTTDLPELPAIPELPDTVALKEPLDPFVSFTTEPPPVTPSPEPVVRAVAPDFITRVLAKLIDGTTAGVLYTLCTVLVADWFTGFLLGGVAALLYFLASDGLNVRYMPRRSFGKKVMGLTVTRLDEKPMTVWTSAQRNWMFGVLYFVQAFTFNAPAISILLLLATFGLIGYEVYWVIVSPGGIRWGDDLAGTEVKQLVTETA